jgi:hypothetical protein
VNRIREGLKEIFRSYLIVGRKFDLNAFNANTFAFIKNWCVNLYVILTRSPPTVLTEMPVRRLILVPSITHPSESVPKLLAFNGFLKT